MYINNLCQMINVKNGYSLLMYYRKFNRYDEEDNDYFGKDLQDLHMKFEEYIEAFNEEKIQFYKTCSNHYFCYCILQNNPLLIERAFIFCCAKNDINEVKSIYYSFIDNSLKNTNKGAKKIFEKTRQQDLIMDLCDDCYYDIIDFIVENNIFSDINYNNLLRLLCEEMNYSIVYSVLDILYLHAPNLLYIETDTLVTCFQIAINYQDFDLMLVLQMYRPFQLGCQFEDCNGIDKIDGLNQAKNYYKINFIGEHGKNFNWGAYSLGEIDYDAIKNRMDFVPEGCEISLKEELMRNRFHPKYIDKWIDWGHNEPEDLE